ncbi:hypothetical protein, partial [Endozoicomonas sp. SESOKO1]|uniref:hypothetical protein n=1 Tax=Endozoicomonas sp. SESOKO1 TaxID=2828742 RepID=UPI002148EB91
AGWRWDLYSYTQKSKSKTFNALGRILLSDPVNGSGKGMGADLSADREAAWFIGRVFEKSVGIFKKAKSVDGNINRDNFGSEVWKQTEYGGSSNPHVQAMADMMQEHYRLMMNRLKAAGVEGAEFISTGGKYQPRIWNRDIHDKIKTNVMSEDAVRSAIRNAYANMVDDTVTPETIDKVVDAIVENGLRIKDDVDFTTHFSSVMKGVDPRFKRRINLDMSATSDDGSVSIADLVETNSFKLYESYMRKMSGRLALAERGIKSYDQLAELRNTIGKELREAGEDPKKTMDMLDDIEDALQGHAARRMAREGYADWIRQSVKGAKSLSALNMLGSAAFAMIPEFVAASAEVGFAHVIKQMPILRSMGSKHKKEVMNQLDYMAVNMTDGQWNNYFTADVLDGTRGTKVNRTFDDINRFTYKASLMNAGERFTRNTFINAGVSRIGKEMRKNGKLKETTRRALGLSKEDTEYLEAQLRQHMKTRKGFFGTEVEDLAPDSWRTADGKVDVKAHRIMADGLQKLANTATARSTAGERIHWIDGTVQSFWLQFQNTVINSWQRVVLRGLGGTKEQAAGHILGVIMGGLAAWGMTTTRDNLRTFGNAEAQQKLEDRTGAEKIARNMSYVPALGALYVALEKSSFLYTWGTGETFDGFRYESAETALFSMPALSLLENTIAMPHRLMEGDIDAAIRAVPMQSWYLFKPILNMFRNW